MNQFSKKLNGIPIFIVFSTETTILVRYDKITKYINTVYCTSSIIGLGCGKKISYIFILFSHGIYSNIGLLEKGLLTQNNKNLYWIFTAAHIVLRYFEI